MPPKPRKPRGSPRGKPPKPPVTVPDEVIEVSINDVQAQLATRMRELVENTSTKEQMRILEETPDLVTTLVAIAKGVKVETASELTYRTLPHPQSLIYALNWSRDIIRVIGSSLSVGPMSETDRKKLRQEVVEEIRAGRGPYVGHCCKDPKNCKRTPRS